MGEQKKTSWGWKVGAPGAKDRRPLLYEPGNWGDILKGLWAATVVRERLRSDGRSTLHYLDPFAGSPTYPLVDASRARLENGPCDLFHELQADFARRDELASTALVVATACRREGAKVTLDVFDLEAERRKAWQDVSDANLLECASGEDALEEAVVTGCRADLVLVDPYDFLANWRRLLALAIAAAQHATVLVYLYNRAPRGSGYKRSYDAFRRACRSELKKHSTPAILGRLPSDAILPRAYHEVLLLGRAVPGSRAELHQRTASLARALADTSAFEHLQ